jgi:hypothetical protein
MYSATQCLQAINILSGSASIVAVVSWWTDGVDKVVDIDIHDLVINVNLVRS